MVNIQNRLTSVVPIVFNFDPYPFVIVKANKSIFQTISDHHVCSVKINLRKHWHDRGDGGAAYL